MKKGGRNVHVKTRVYMDALEVSKLFNEVLEEYTDGMWIDEVNGKLMCEEYTSHKYDVEVASVDDENFAIQVAGIRLQRALKHNG